MNQKKLLYEVSVIRPLIIFLLVLLHSFTKIKNGDGLYFNDYELINGYEWFAWLIQGFRIETIALIAGYVFSYQSHDLKRRYRFFPFLWKKFKRLIIPMLIFGIIYYFCFHYTTTFNIREFTKEVLFGCGHLWFLPMLFWCFITIWIIDKYNLSSWLTLLLLAAFSVMPIPALPYSLVRLPHFLFYVYAGYFLWEKHDYLFNHFLSGKYAICLWVVYVALVVVTHYCAIDIIPSMNIFQKVLGGIFNRTIGLLMSCCGIMALYISVCQVTNRENYHPKPWVVKASDNCYGVYVYHQFVLMYLYFFTPFVSVVHPLLVPWVGCIIILVVSLILTWFTLKTKIGRFLIG